MSIINIMFGFFSDSFLFFGLRISYYGIIIAVAMGLGVWLACKNARFRNVKTNDLIIAACYVLPLAIIGARIYYFVTNLSMYTSFWQIFEIWKGGLAIYGGVIGGTLGVGLYSLIHKKNFFDIADVVVPSLILGQGIGRIGCYFAGCCYGMVVTDPKFQWFPLSTFLHGEWHLSTFFYESIWDFATFAVLMLLLRKFKIKQRGAISAWYLIIYGVGRAWIEALRGGEGGDSIRIGPVQVSLVLSLILIVAGIVILLFYYFWFKKHPEKVVQYNFQKQDSTKGEILIEKPEEQNSKKREVKFFRKKGKPENKTGEKNEDNKKED